MKICKKCQRELDDESFHRRGNGRRGTCRECVAQYQAAHYEANRERYIVGKKSSVANRRREIRSFLEEAKRKPCADCGISYPPWVMQFDHVRDQKVFALAVASRIQPSQNRIMAEIAKCEVVCANCHADRTYRRRAECKSAADGLLWEQADGGASPSTPTI